MNITIFFLRVVNDGEWAPGHREEGGPLNPLPKSTSLYMMRAPAERGKGEGGRWKGRGFSRGLRGGGGELIRNGDLGIINGIRVKYKRL